MNNISISGRMTKDIELKTTTSGISVCSFSVAVDRPAVKDKVDFIDCVAWRHTAEFVCKYFKKGDPVELSGVLTTRSYDDKNGTKHKVCEIFCEHVDFPKQKKKEETDSVPSEFFEETPYEEELPF